MSKECEMIRDLLPLYHDKVCSEASREAVEAHAAECPACREELRRLGMETVDLHLQQARQEVLAAHDVRVKREVARKSAAVGTVTAALFAVPVLVCLIVNLTTGRTLDWFFIVLASLAVVASITVVPALAPRRKALWMVGLFTVTLLLLLMTVCLYTGGRWFWVAGVSVLLGLTVFALPFVMHQKPMPAAWLRHKGLVVIVIATGLLYLLLLAVGQFIGGDAAYGRNAALITAVCLPLPWAVFLTCRYAPMTKRGKAGLCLLVSSMFTVVINDIIDWILEGTLVFRAFQVDYLRWTIDNVSANVNLLVCAVLAAAGLILLAARGKRKLQ